MNEHPWSSAEGEASYQAMLHRAEQEAQATWRQGEEYRNRKAKDEALRRALAPLPPSPTDQTSPCVEPPLEMPAPPPAPSGHASPILSQQPASAPPPKHCRAPKTQPSESGLLERNSGTDALLLIAILFFLWRERADKEILLALVYILLW